MPRKKKSETASPKPRKTATRAVKPKKKTAVQPARAKSAPAAKAPKAAKPAPRKSPSVARPGSTAKKEPSKLPRMGETQVVSFLRDPHCLFTYWEVTPQEEERIRGELKAEYAGSRMGLRVFKDGVAGHNEMVYEFEVAPGEMNRYLELDGPGGTYFVEVGRKAGNGRWVPYARSNRVHTHPASDVFWSSQVDPSWEPAAGLLDDFVRQGYPGLLKRGVSSAEGAGNRNRPNSSPF